MSMSSVRVAVRVRPLNKREKQMSSKVIIHMEGKTTSIRKPSPVRGEELKDRGTVFSYDFSYDSCDRGSATFASQEKIFQDLGSDVLKAAFEGFNACVFAYGQTGSGKSYTMMGHKEDKGLIPRICEGLFWEILQRQKTDAVSFHTEVSYLEIYNERVQDLLKKRTPLTDGGGLKVREHPRDGPYVENLSKHLVHNHSEMEDLIILGNANRSIASTGMNDSSSRSHAILTIKFIQAWFDAELPREMVSKLHLVDLAGSERAHGTCATGTRLKEGANINKSLVTLGSVISALAISPSDVNYVETLSTLRYASRAKNIVNSPTVNEDSSMKMIRELQEEVTRLRRRLEETTQVFCGELAPSVKVEEEKLHQNEAKVVALTKEWTSKWGETRSILEEETVALRKEGGRVILDCQLPHLICIDEDLLSTGIILYYLKEGRTFIGSDEASCNQDIVQYGPRLLSEHCMLENRAGIVTLFPQDGALCLVNGSVVTESYQLTQGAVIQLGSGTILRFNHPTEVSLRRDKRQSRLPSIFNLSLTDLPKSTENPFKVMLQNPGRVEEELNQQEVGCQQVLESLNRCNRDIKRLPRESSGAPHRQTAESSFSSQMDLLPVETAESKGPNVWCTSTPKKKLMTAAIPGRYPVPHSSLELDGDAPQGGVSTRDGQEQEKDLCHKSGPELMSERLQRNSRSGAGVAGYEEEEVWSGDASLQQTSVLGLGDGCGMKPEGNANEIQGVMTDCYKGRPGSGGSSLGSMSHLQSSAGRSSTSVLSQTSIHSQLDRKPLSSQEAGCPPKETTFEGQMSCGEMDESRGLVESPGVRATDTAGATVQNSRLGSLFSRVSWIVQDAGRLLRYSPTVLQQVMEVRLQPIGARWSSHVVSLVRKSNVLSVVKDSQVFSMVRGSIVFSLLRESQIFSMVKELPLIQHIQMDITQHLQPDEAAQMVPMPPKHLNETEVTHAPKDVDQASDNPGTVQMVIQMLIDFPESLVNLQTLPLPDMMDALQSVISTEVLASQKIVAAYWLNVAKWSQPEPQPAILILMETDLYTLTTDSGLLVLFHHLPLVQLKEMRVGLAGHSLRLMGTTEESILGVYTHNQTYTKELCRVILDVICPGDSRVSQHPLLHGNLMKMFLDWQVYVPDLLLDAGLRVCCQFQRSLADLVYLLHCNIDQETVGVGEVRLLLYTSVAVCMSSSTHSEHLAQFLLTDTHLGLVQEDAVFQQTPFSVTIAPCRPQFHDLTLRQCSDVRCLLVHDEDKSGSVTLDVILADVRGRGHPESMTEAGTPSLHALNSSPHAEVWKLTFSCSTEATCLINHLSNF